MGAKLDMGKAWNDAVALLSANKDVVFVLAGVFFFLPTAIYAMLVPQTDPVPPPDGATPEQVAEILVEQLSATWADIWWIAILAGIAQAIGVLALMTLLTDSRRPTVGEAIKIGAISVISYVVAQILYFLALGLGFGLLVGGTAAISPMLSGVMVLPALVLFIYVSIKFILLAPVIAIERQLNPIAALGRSWQLTKGNSLRIFAFLFLIGLVILVLSLIVGMLFTLFATMGDSIGTIVLALGNGIITMAYTSVIVAVLAAIYYQLSGGGPRQAEVFD